jgi:uncharacterized protein Yka (UPF0111/DUF47 family)
MEKDKISTPEKLEELKNEIADKEKNSIFRTAKSMGQLVRLMLNNNLEDIESVQASIIDKESRAFRLYHQQLQFLNSEI